MRHDADAAAIAKARRKVGWSLCMARSLFLGNVWHGAENKRWAILDAAAWA